MKQFANILVAVDFSAYSKAAAKHAFDLARELGATVIFVHVINQRDFNIVRHAITKMQGSEEADLAMEEFVENTKEERADRLHGLIDAINDEGMSYDAQVRIGIPYQELLKSIGEFEADLMVMGIKGNSDLPDANSGSTALKMFRRSSIPLVTVRKYKP